MPRPNFGYNIQPPPQTIRTRDLTGHRIFERSLMVEACLVLAAFIGMLIAAPAILQAFH